MALTFQYCDNCTGVTSATTVSYEVVNASYIVRTNEIVCYDSPADGVDEFERFPDDAKSDCCESQSDYDQRFKFTIPSPISCDITIQLSANTVQTRENSTTGAPLPTVESNFITNLTYTIPAGSTETQEITLRQREIRLPIFSFNCPDGINTDTVFTYTASTKGTLARDCFVPPDCFLEITSSTVTDVSFRGGSDGSITVAVSGASGATIYSIDGGAFQGSNTFSNLPAGDYDIVAKDSNDCVASATVTVPDGKNNQASTNITVNEPSNLVASENPIIINLSTEKISTQRINAEATITVSDAVENNDTITFNLTAPINYNVTYTAKDFPNRDNYFLTDTIANRDGDIIGTNTTDEILSSLAEVLQKDITLSRYYAITIDRDNDTIKLRAKQNGSRFTLDSNNLLLNTASNGLILSNSIRGVDTFKGDQLNDYSLWCEVHVADNLQFGDPVTGGTYRRISELELPYSFDNIHRFDFSSILKTQVSTPRPDLDFTGFTTYPSMLKPFKFVYGEKFPLVNGENTKKKLVLGETDGYWVKNHSLDYQLGNNIITLTGVTATSTTNTDVPFLTNSPNPLQIQRGQQEYLYFLLPKNYGQQLDVRGDIDFYDGSSITGVTFFEIEDSGDNLGGVYGLNISYDSLGLSTYENSGNTKIKRCTFAVYQQSGASRYTEEKTYFLEIDEQPRRFGVAFENKQGVYDTFDFIGIVEETIDRSSKTYTVPRLINNSGASPEAFKSTSSYDTTVVKRIVVNSGWIDQDHFDWLVELMGSNNLFSYTTTYDNYLNVSGFQYSKSSLDDLYNLEVTFTATIRENNISV